MSEEDKIWNFEAPPYDQRSSVFISAGESHGVGKRQPVGSEKPTSKSPIPKGCYMKDANALKKEF